MPDESTGFGETGFESDLARLMAGMRTSAEVDRTAGLEAEVVMLREALAVADAEIHRLNDELAAVTRPVRCICGPLASSDGEDIDVRPDCPAHGERKMCPEDQWCDTHKVFGVHEAWDVP